MDTIRNPGLAFDTWFWTNSHVVYEVSNHKKRVQTDWPHPGMSESLLLLSPPSSLTDVNLLLTTAPVAYIFSLRELSMQISCLVCPTKGLGLRWYSGRGCEVRRDWLLPGSEFERTDASFAAPERTNTNVAARRNRNSHFSSLIISNPDAANANCCC